MKIPKKEIETLEKYGQMSAARRKSKKLIIEYIKEIANLRKPIYPKDGTEKLVLTDEKLISDSEYRFFINSEVNAKNLVWINTYQPIDNNGKVVQDQNKQNRNYRMYRGQWKTQGISSMISINKDTDKQLNTTVWEGIGEILFPDGSIYQGQTKNGKFNGKGRMTHANGDIYQGEWLNGKAYGNGTFVDTTGSMYEGQWKDDQQHGYGVESWQFHKIKYSGQFQFGQKTGRGRFEFESGFYEGDFVDGQFHGQGKYHFGQSGKVYEGDFVNNNMEGKGIMIWADGSRYEGDFKSGKIEGQGTKVFSNGNTYIGWWKNDLQHGSGVYLSVKDQTKRQGDWLNGKRVSWQSSPVRTHISAPNGQRSSMGGTTSPQTSTMRSRVSIHGISSYK